MKTIETVETAATAETAATIVVGAGFSGLSYAHYAGTDDCVVLESAPRVGGLIRTVGVDDPFELRFESGPETMADPSGGARALADELGVETNSTPDWASKRFLVSGGRLVAASPKVLFAGPLLRPAERLRLMTEPLRSRRKGLDGSIADFMRHRLGRGALDALVDPMISGIYGGDPELLSARACFPSLVDGVEKHGSLVRYLFSRRGSSQPEHRRPWKPKGGMSAIPDALRARLGDRIRCSTVVRGLERTGNAWTVRIEEAGEPRTLRARRVVLALPLRAAARLLLEAVPAAGRQLASATSENLASVVHAYRRSDVDHPLDGFGYLVPKREGLTHLGTLFSSSLDPDCAPADVVVLRTLLGGARRPEQVRASDAELTGIVESEVRDLLGIRAAPLWSHIVRHESVIPRYDLDHPARIAALATALPPSLSLLGNHQRGIGLSALLEQARSLAELHRADGDRHVAPSSEREPAFAETRS